MPKRLLLTGLPGSIGIHVFAHLCHNTDWDVVGIDSFRHKGLTDRVSYMLNAHPEWRERLTIFTHDLIAPISPMLRGKIGKVDYIINMASLSDVFDSIVNPVPFVQNNVALVLNMLEFAREVKPEVFIQISTDEVYGAMESKDSQGIKEWSPIVPSNPYAASKACQEAIAISYWRTYGVPLIITNTMNNYGEMQQPNKYPVIVQKLVSEGKTVKIHGNPENIGSRSYIHSRNFADALLFLIKNVKPYEHQNEKADKPDRFNIAGDRQLDNVELAKLIADLMGRELKYELEEGIVQRPGHDPHYALDDTKIKSLDWKSPVSFEESLKGTIKWQQENEEWIKQ